jgi:hypothetical protein
MIDIENKKKRKKKNQDSQSNKASGNGGTRRKSRILENLASGDVAAREREESNPEE